MCLRYKPHRLSRPQRVKIASWIAIICLICLRRVAYAPMGATAKTSILKSLDSLPPMYADTTSMRSANLHARLPIKLWVNRMRSSTVNRSKVPGYLRVTLARVGRSKLVAQRSHSRKRWFLADQFSVGARLLPTCGKTRRANQNNNF